MKLVLSFVLFGLSLQAFAIDEARTSCPKTRSCKADRDCRTYAFKHNCHAQCRSVSLQIPGGKSEQCSQQCLCLKKIKLENA
jgi:hypothetical protein